VAVTQQQPRRLLRRLGISHAAELVWRVLLTNPDASVLDFESGTGLTADQIAGAIAELTSAGLTRAADTPVGAVAIDPSLALETQLVRSEREMAERAEEFAAIRAEIPDLTGEFARGRASAGDLPGFEIVVPLQDIRRQLYLAAERVTNDLRSTEHAPYRSMDFTDGQPAQTALLARGVRDRTIVPPHALDDPDLYAEYERMETLGHETRMLANISTRIVIYDRDLAIVPVDPTNMPLGAIFIRVPSVIDALILMYDHMWSVATPVFTSLTDSDAPSGRSARVLELLAIGTKDERIARNVGIGVRTVRREVADLKVRLNVNSRAEIAAAAVRKGWL
jgi:DNA-binding CsgD family transcriptional regulator